MVGMVNPLIIAALSILCAGAVTYTAYKIDLKYILKKGNPTRNYISYCDSTLDQYPSE